MKPFRSISVILLLCSAIPAAAQNMTYIGDAQRGVPAFKNIKSLCTGANVAAGVDCVEAARAICAQQFGGQGATYENTTAILRGYDENTSEIIYGCFTTG